jgi:hypothetical protein
VYGIEDLINEVDALLHSVWKYDAFQVRE